MTLEIKINAHVDHGPLKSQVDEAMAALGFFRQTATAIPGIDPVAEQRIADAAVKQFAEQMERPNKGVTAFTDVEVQSGGTTTAAPQRERGKPAPGRARRTKEEIAEDEAADKADAEAAAARGNISSDPENRVGPEDDPETEAQDQADEKAEVEANREPEKPLTREDVKAGMTKYLQAYGMPATQEDGPKLIGQVLGEPPKGEEAWKLSLVPEDDQAALRKLVSVFEQATTANPYKRDKVA